MQNALLTTNKLCKTFSTRGVEQQVLIDLNLTIYDGDFTVIMGPSGAGKSTLLYALSGMDKPTGGSVSFLGHDISNLTNDKLAVFRRDNCGFVFQQTFLLDNMSILDNILACGLLVNRNRKEIVERAKMLLELLNLDKIIWHKFPSQVSGGEAQRSGIVRALINNPQIVFADEPTGALNSANGDAVLDALSEINRQGQSVVMVTHDMRCALRGNRILYIRDGVISGECLLEKYNVGDSERTVKVTDFLAQMEWGSKQEDVFLSPTVERPVFSHGLQPFMLSGKEDELLSPKMIEVKEVLAEMAEFGW